MLKTGREISATKAGSSSAVERYGTVIIKVSVASLFYPFYFCFILGKKYIKSCVSLSLSTLPSSARRVPVYIILVYTHTSGPEGSCFGNTVT